MPSILNTGLQTTDKKLYFLCVDTQERLEIQFVPPNVDISDEADLSTIKVIGRNTPKYQTTGGEVTLKLTLDFYADEESRSSVIRKCNWLRSLRYTDRGNKPSKRVALIFGKMFTNEIWTVKSVNPKFSDFSKPHEFLPKQAYVDVSLCLDVDYNLGWEDINATYDIGLPDGSNPVKVGKANPDDENDDWRFAESGNDFKSIARRALERLGLDHGYYY